MLTVDESVCCHEVYQVNEQLKFHDIFTGEEIEAACITAHPGFQSVCLNPWTLKVACYAYKQEYKKEHARLVKDHTMNEYVIKFIGHLKRNILILDIVRFFNFFRI